MQTPAIQKQIQRGNPRVETLNLIQAESLRRLPSLLGGESAQALHLRQGMGGRLMRLRQG
jgi:hypothetical protein